MEIHSDGAWGSPSLARIAEAARTLEAELRAYLAPARPERDVAERLRNDAETAYAAGNPERAVALLDAALERELSPRVRARVQHLRGRIETRRGPPLAAHELLVTEAEAVAAADPEQASAMLADASFAAISAGAPSAARATAGRARELALEPPAVAKAELALGTALLLGEDTTAGEQLIRSALNRAFDPRRDPGASAAETAVVALYWLEEYDAVLQLLEILIDRGRRTGDPRLSQWIDTSAAAIGAQGRWTAAEARSREALRLARERRQRTHEASCLTTLAWISAQRGREQDCRRYVAEALAAQPGNDLVFAWGTSALALLELGQGELNAAITTLQALVNSEAAQIRGDPALTYALAHLVEAYVGLGRTQDAADTLRRLEDLARDSPRASVAAITARCRGLVAPLGEFELHFQTALEHHRHSPVPFSRAQTELAFGARLRRARRRADARTHLHAALATFEQLGATAWAERARRELAAASGRSTPTSKNVAELLTSQELAVATLVSRGLRNDDIAATLYVTRRAVEYHLTNIYRKLEIRSRTQLVRILARQ